jgi:hypothetical protein
MHPIQESADLLATGNQYKSLIYSFDLSREKHYARVVKEQDVLTPVLIVQAE